MTVQSSICPAICVAESVEQYEDDKTKTKKKKKSKASSHCGADSSTILTTSRNDLSPEGLRLGPLEHLGYYSIVGNTTRYDMSAFRRFQQPALENPVDLNRGKRRCIVRNRHNYTLAHPIPLDGILGACHHFGRLGAIRDAHVVTGRGVLVRLMEGKSLKLHVSFIDGVLYLIKADEDPRQVRVGELERSYHGYAFEAYCTQEDPDEAFDVSLDVWRCIVTRTLGDLDVVFGAEIDCCKGEYLGNSNNFLELKMRPEQGFPMRHHCYLQALLADVPEICVGYGDKNRVLTKSEILPTSRFKPGRDMNKEFTYAHGALQTLRQSCSSYDDWERGNLDDIIWEASIERGCVSDLRVLKQLEVTKLRTYADGERLGLLPADMVNELRRLKRRVRV